MATTVTLRLSSNAHTFNTDKSTGFAIRGGVKYHDRETNKDEWTNYEAVVFASSPKQVDYYMQSLVEGAIVEVSANKLKIKVFEGQNGQKLSIELLNAELGLIAQSAPRDNHQQGGYQQHAPHHNGGYQQAPQQNGYQRGNGRQQPPAQNSGYQQQAPQQNGGYQRGNGRQQAPQQAYQQNGQYGDFNNQ